MVFCPNCGTNATQGGITAKFCSNCGNQIAKSPNSSPSVPKTKLGGATTWATTNHPSVSPVTPPTNKFNGGQYYQQGKGVGIQNKATPNVKDIVVGRAAPTDRPAHEYSNNPSPSSNRSDVVRSGLPPPTYGKQPSWAYGRDL